jgi:hypothetical protein
VQGEVGGCIVEVEGFPEDVVSKSSFDLGRWSISEDCWLIVWVENGLIAVKIGMIDGRWIGGGVVDCYRPWVLEGGYV